MGLGAQRNPLSISEWQVMATSMNSAVQAMPTDSMPYYAAPLSTRGTGDQLGLGQGFIPPSLAGPDMKTATGRLLRAQDTAIHNLEGAASRESAIASGVTRMPGASSQRSDLQGVLRDSMVAQQHQVPPFASAPFGNPSMRLQASLGTAPLPPSADFHSALLRAGRGPTLFRDFPQRDHIFANAFLGEGLPTNIAGLGQVPFLGAPPLRVSQGLTPQIPDASHLASLTDGKRASRKNNTSIPSQERDRRPVDTHPAMTGVARGILEPFPERLHRLLTEVEAAGHSDIVSFTEDKQTFKIHKPNEFFHKIVPVYFNQTRLSSFKRQLNLYGFELIDHGKAKGGYYHKLFMKDEPDLARQIRRIDNKYVYREGEFRKEKKNRHGSSGAPDFYSMPPILSSEEAEKKLAASRSSGEKAKMETSSTTDTESDTPKTKRDSGGIETRGESESSDEDNRDSKKPSTSESA